MSKRLEKKSNKPKEKGRLLTYIGASVGAVFIQATPVFASLKNVGSNISGWVISNGFLLALALFVCICIPQIAKKSWVTLIGTIALGAIILSLIGTPTQVKGIGDDILSIILGK